MKNIAILGCSALVSVILGSTAFAKSIVVVNNTEYALNELYASPSDAGDWNQNNPNLIHGAVGPGQQKTFTINDGTSGCNYDLMGVLAGTSQHAYQYQVNVCNGDSWTVTR